MSRVQLYKRLLSVTGTTPSEFIRTIRLQHAEQLLRQSQQGVSEIAYQVGFNNPRYFSKYFTEMYGVTPSQYKHKFEKDR
jgi:AraC-like DNA-binding protein